MKRLPEGQLKFCVQPLHLTSWLLLFFFLKSLSSLKPARLPIYQRKPFVAAWNAPIDQCLIKYNIRLNLKMFQMIGSPFAKARGQNVTIFYVDRLGYYPWYTSQGAPVNGGLPQNTSLQVHLQKVDQDINYYIPAKDFSGLAVIDWEHWRPQWARNWGEKNVYRQKSRKLVSDSLKNASATDIECLAKATFEQSANAFMKETIELGLKSRPNGLWGYYLYPDCHNYNVEAPNYTGSCPEKEVLRNNELSWLWNSSAALYPAIGVRKSLGDGENLLHFSRFRVHESMRVSAMTSRDYALPVFVYARLDYRDEPLFFLSKLFEEFPIRGPLERSTRPPLTSHPLKFLGLLELEESPVKFIETGTLILSTNDLRDQIEGPDPSDPAAPPHCAPLPDPGIQTMQNPPSHCGVDAFSGVWLIDKQGLIRTIGESAALGAAGIVIWGDMNLTSSKGNCTKVKRFVSSDLGSYIVNVTRAAEMCSLHLCRNNGRCIRKAWKAPDYLHLNPASYHIEASEDGEFHVKGEASDADLAGMAEKFSCHCYQGFEGADCRDMEAAGTCSGVSPFPGSLGALCLLALAGFSSI